MLNESLSLPCEPCCLFRFGLLVTMHPVTDALRKAYEFGERYLINGERLQFPLNGETYARLEVGRHAESGKPAIDSLPLHLLNHAAAFLLLLALFGFAAFFAVLAFWLEPGGVAPAFAIAIVASLAVQAGSLVVGRRLRLA